VKAEDVQNHVVPDPSQADLNVEDIADVLAKLRIVDSSLEQGSSKKEEEKKEEPYEIGGEDEPTPSLAQNA